MATTVHIPKRLLQKVDQRAKVLGVSRNRLIVDALESSLASKQSWSPELIEMLARPLDRETARVLDETISEVARRRANRRRTVKL